MGPISTALFSGGSSGATFSRAGPKARPTGSASRGVGILLSSGKKKTDHLAPLAQTTLSLHLVLPIGLGPREVTQVQAPNSISPPIQSQRRGSEAGELKKANIPDYVGPIWGNSLAFLKFIF